MNTLSSRFVKQVQEEVKPLYNNKNVDRGHNWENHIQTVINNGLLLAKFYLSEIDLDIIYACCAYHDTGLMINRENHHNESAIIVQNSKVLRSYFTLEELDIIIEAVQDHRNSIKTIPRSLYGKILSDADKLNSPKESIIRAWFYRQDKRPDLIKLSDIIKDIHKLIKERYASGDYLGDYYTKEAVELRKQQQHIYKHWAQNYSAFEIVAQQIIENL